MGKILLNCIAALSVLFIASLFISPPGAGAVDYGGNSIHGGTAWEAYNRGDLAEAERQFLFLIDKADQEKHMGKKPEEILNLKLGLAYTKTKLADLILSKEISSPSEEMPALSKQLLISSKELFEDLIRKNYKLRDSVPAMLGILSRLKEYKTMDQYLPMVETLFSGKELDKWSYLFAESAWAAYNAKNYRLAEKKFKTLLEKKLNENMESDTPSLVAGLGYSLYQQEKYGAAYDSINDLMQSRNIKSTPELSELKRMVCLKLADPLVSKINKGKYAFSKGVDNTLYHRHKGGDDGTSRLDETAVSVSLSSPERMSEKDITIFLKSRHLSNGGSDNSAAYGTGSFYRSLNGEAAHPFSDNDGLLVYEAAVKWKSDGAFDLKNRLFDLEIELGTSSAGGAVDATEVFTVTIEQGRWRADIHRTGVDDSILSISGLDDPYPLRNADSSYINGENGLYQTYDYHNLEWGGVVRNGVSLDRNFPLGSESWLSLNGSFDEYRGVNVWNNSSLQLNGAAGRTITRNNGDELTFGIYLTWMHFEHNSNFYTFGHGGYYSPDFMLTAGPILRYKTAACRDYWVDLQLSFGWMKERNADAPKYPIHYGVVDQFTDSALDELQGRYKGEDKEGVACSMKLEGWKLITGHLAAGSFFSMGSSSDYLDLRIGAQMEYSFHTRTVFFRSGSE